MAFDSAGAGFSRGFARGAGIRLQKQEMQSQKEAREQARLAEQGRELRESLAQAREQSLVGFRQAVELATKASESGATDQQIATIKQMAAASLASFATTAQGLRQQAAQAGAPPELVTQLPDGLAFVQENMPMFDAAVETGRLGTASAVGAREGQQQVSEAESIARALTQSSGREVTVDSVARAMNLIPQDPEPERVGQRVVRGIGEAEVFRDKGTNQLFVQDAQGNRTVIGSSDLTTPTARQEQGGPGSFDPRTQSQQGEDVQAFQNSAISFSGAIQTATELAQIAAETPEALGAPGTIIRVGNEFARTAQALGSMLGVDVGIERPMENFDFSKFRGAAIENQAFRAGIYSIALATAVAEQGSRPSDKDVQFILDQLAASTADPKAFGRVIGTFVERLDRRIRTTARVKNIPQEIQDSAFVEMDAALSQFREMGATGTAGFDDLAAQAEAAIAAGDLEKAEELIRQIESGNN